MTCRDLRGREVTIGAGVTHLGDVVLIGPPHEQVPNLSPKDATTYIDKVRQAWFAASTPYP